MNKKKMLRRVVIDSSSDEESMNEEIDEENMEDFADKEENFNVENDSDMEDEEQIEEEKNDECEEENEEIDEESSVNFDEEDEPDYIDNSSQLWKFVCRIEDSQDLGEFMGRMGGMMVKKEDNKKWKKFACNENSGACPFQAIFLKSCSNLYSRDAHNHGQGIENEAGTRKNTSTENIDEPTCSTKKIKKATKCNNSSRGKNKKPTKISQYYVDMYGKKWQFRAQIDGKNQPRDVLHKEYGFTSIMSYKRGLSGYCHRNAPMDIGGKCHYAGVYLHANRCVYTRGEHECFRKNYDDKIYLDHYGKKWDLYGQIGKNVTREQLRMEYGFCTIKKTQQGFRMRCEKIGPNGRSRRCPYAGVYLQANGCLYTRGEHEEHEYKEKWTKAPKIGENYIDMSGKEWKFHLQISDDITKQMWMEKFGFSKVKTKVHSLNLGCLKNGPNGGNCPYSGVYLRTNGCLYTRGEHQHKIDAGNNFLIRHGSSWPLVAKIGKNLSKSRLQSKFGISVFQRDFGFYLLCAKNAKDSGAKCRFRAVYVKSNGFVYAKKKKHDHPDAVDFKDL